jgi:hypothetical protein
MKKCNRCNITTSNESDVCPLCGRRLEQGSGGSSGAYPAWRKPKGKELIKIIPIAAAFLILLLVLVNVAAWRGTLWSATAAGSILYVWLLGLLTFKKGVHPGMKLTAHALSLILLLIAANAFSTSGILFHAISWAFSYATPIILITVIAAINAIVIYKRRHLRGYLPYQLILCVAGTIPLMIIPLLKSEPAHLSIISASCSIATVVGLFVFARKPVLSELGKRLHF